MDATLSLDNACFLKKGLHFAKHLALIFYMRVMIFPRRENNFYGSVKQDLF
jgi:hypothetical protein